YAGEFFNIKDFSLLLKSTRKDIPIYLAAINKKMVDLTWEIADGVIFYLRPLDELKNTIPIMQSRKKIDVTCQLITAISEDADEAIHRAKKTIAFYVSVGSIYREFLAQHGFEKETQDIFDEYKKSGFKDSFNCVSDNMVNALSVCGTPDDARKQLFKFIDAGVDLPILQFNPSGDVQESFNLLVSTFGSDMN